MKTAGLTLVEVYGQVSSLWEREHANKLGIVVLELLAHPGQLVLGEEPVLALRGIPVVGRHVGQREACHDMHMPPCYCISSVSSTDGRIVEGGTRRSLPSSWIWNRRWPVVCL